MDPNKSRSQDSFWSEDPFGIIKPDEFADLGINPSDITPGTLAAHRHPPLLSSRFGGNAYGFGFFEIYDRLESGDLKLIQSIEFDNQEHIKNHATDLNRIYKKIGLLIRFSAFGVPYYLIPSQLVSESVKNIKDKADEITKIIDFHCKKYAKDNLVIGVLTHDDDPIINNLNLRFKEHDFRIINTPAKFGSIKEPFDMVILTRDIYRTILLEKLRRTGETISGEQLEQHALYTIWKIYKILKPDGEIFIIANSQPVKTNHTAQITFRTLREKKRFLFFTHIFKTRKRYRIKKSSITVNIFDLEMYLGSRYIEPDILNRLSGGRDLEKMSLEEINNLPFLNMPLYGEFNYDQRKAWLKILPLFFDGIFHKPLITHSITDKWKKRFSIRDYSPDYMLIYLGQKKRSGVDIAALKKDISESNLAGSPLSLLADYRDSFGYLIRCLNILKNIKDTKFADLPEVFMERLKEPFENKKRRYIGFNYILKLMSKIGRLELVSSCLNPDMVKGARTSVMENLEILPLFGFSYGEMKEIILIISGHTTGDRILSGKMHEKTLKPLTDLAKTLDRGDAINLLRYCRLMSMAEMMASRRTGVGQKNLVELFDLFEYPFKVLTVNDMDWDTLLDEKISAIGGIHNKLVRKLLMMMNRFEFLDNWAELTSKGEMERDVIANYDKKKIWEIDGIIDLVRILDRIRNKFLKDDPLQSPVIYRKFLNTEYHGTGQIFESMDSQLVFILLWLAVNVSRGDIVNFNPILDDSEHSDIERRIKRVEEDIRAINRDKLDINALKQFSSELYENNSAFFINTGFRFMVNRETQSLDIHHIDLDEKIDQFELLAKSFSGRRISELKDTELEEMEKIFADLEDFYLSHRRLLSRYGSDSGIPERQKRWFHRVEEIRDYLKINFINAIFAPEDIYTDLDILIHHSPSILRFALPELMALQKLNLSGKAYLKSPIIDHILASARKIQALIRGDLKDFQDIQRLHKLAQMEFGPMAAGIIGFNDSQTEVLMSIISRIKRNPILLEALIKNFIFHDIGLTPSLREKYRDRINSADQSRAGAFFIIEEGIPLRYNTGRDVEKALVFLIKYHDWILHFIKGEHSVYSLKEILDESTEDLFDAFFVSSLVMTSALSEGCISEDMAARMMAIRDLGHRVIKGEITLEDSFKELYIQKGRIFFALEEYNKKGITDGKTPSEFLESWDSGKISEARYIEAGKIVAAMERIFRLRNLTNVEFNDLAKLIVNVPVQFIYKKKSYYGVSCGTFEKDLSESLHIYNIIQNLPDNIRSFILGRLSGDKIRIYGFENVGIFLNYESMIKLLLIAFLGSEKFTGRELPLHLDFLSMAENIDRRFEAINDALSNISVSDLWGSKNTLNQFFKAKTGIILKKDEVHRVLTVGFTDTVNIWRKTAHMDKIADIDQLKAYYIYSMESLKKTPFFTEDYEELIEEAFNKRLREIIDLIIDNAKVQMDSLKNPREIDHLYADLINRSLSLAIDFSEEQKHRLNDLYELKKDDVREEKLKEINGMIEAIHDKKELSDLWEKTRIYLLNNRQFLGKEFETIIAKRFDDAARKIKDMSFQVHFIT
jgi:hypothetical protein